MHVDQERWQVISTDHPFEGPVKRPVKRPDERPIKRSTGWLSGVERGLLPPSRFSAAVGDALLWMGVAIVVRIAINLLLSSVAHIWFPSIVLLCLPVIGAVCLVNLAPELGWLLGYRLLLVLFGLLLGGRLWS